MADAPERIWATEDADNFGEDRFHTRHGPIKGLTEYVRADLAPPAAVVEAMERALRAADDYLDRGLDKMARNITRTALANLDKWRAGK